VAWEFNADPAPDVPVEPAAPLPPPEIRRPAAGRLRVRGPRLFDLVTEELALFIGPIAGLVCDPYRLQLESLAGAEQLQALVVRLGAEAGGAEEARRFREQVLQLALEAN
jgi:hypothetical protein